MLYRKLAELCPERRELCFQRVILGHVGAIDVLSNSSFRLQTADIGMLRSIARPPVIP
jgi:hypothetical protein